MKLYDLFELLQSNPQTGIIIEDDENVYCQTLVGYLPVLTYEKLQDRYIARVYVHDNNMHIVLEEL